MSSPRNTFYSVNADTGENTENNLWENGQPKMPKFLQERANKLSKQFHGVDKEKRMLQANENRAQNLRNIQGKAQKFIKKAEVAQAKRAKFQVQNAENTFNQAGSPFKLRGNMADRASKDVIHHQKSTSPVNVASNLEARFAAFESNRAQQMDATVQRARKSQAKVGQAKKKQNQLKAQGVLSAGFVGTVTLDGDTNAATSTHGWGSPMKLPSRLAARAEALQQRFMYSPTSMQQKAAANRKAFLDGVAAKAAKVNAKTAMVMARKAAMNQSNAGMYTVFTTEEGEEVSSFGAAGWNQRAQMPKKLRKRYQALRRKFAYDPEAKMAKAAENYEKALMVKRIKARFHSAKAEQARDRVALREGNAATFSFSANPEENESVQGWGKQSIRIPKRLRNRLQDLSAQFKPKPFAVRDQAAKARRAQFHAAIAAKARSFSGAPRAAGAYTFSFDGDEVAGTANGWTNGSIKLPIHLQARVNKLEQQFKSRPHGECQARADNNRAAFLAGIVAKGKATTMKVHRASPKKSMMQADGFFSVSAAADDQTQEGGWGVRTRLPKRLAKRCNDLQRQYKRAPYAERAAFADVKREMFYDGIANKARATRSFASGKAGIYSIVPADEEEFKMTRATGWGKPVPMPERLSNRVAALKTQFSRPAYAERAAKAINNKEVFLNSVRARCAVNAQRAADAKDRRAEIQENMVIFSNSAPVAMPKHLAERAEKLQSQFAKADGYESRRAQAAMNRANFMEERAKSAARFSGRADTVQQTKAAFAVNMSLINVNGPVDSPVKLPKRLEKRVVALHSKFSYDPAERSARVERNRVAHLAMVKAKANRSQVRIKAAAQRRQGDTVPVDTSGIELEQVNSPLSMNQNDAAVASDVCSKMRKKSCVVM